MTSKENYRGDLPPKARSIRIDRTLITCGVIHCKAENPFCNSRRKAIPLRETLPFNQKAYRCRSSKWSRALYLSRRKTYRVVSKTRYCANSRPDRFHEALKLGAIEYRSYRQHECKKESIFARGISRSRFCFGSVKDVSSGNRLEVERRCGCAVLRHELFFIGRKAY